VEISPHLELWFEDGNIELIAEDVSFRVHKSVLAGSSDFFRDMFSLPQPPAEEAAEGESRQAPSEVPRLQTAETAEDLYYFLDVTYNSLRFVFFPPHDQPTTFCLVEGEKPLGTSPITENVNTTLCRLQILSEGLTDHLCRSSSHSDALAEILLRGAANVCHRPP
jgi:hypothetical protein